MASKQPKSVEIRAYQVGFGDCFLVSFVYSASDKRHVLIDFGTTQLPKAFGKPSEHMPRVANHIKQVCGGKLTAVIATHRHADHISGFATDGKTGKSGEIIAQCKPKVVLQPWTEDPAAARDAKKATTGSNRSAKGFVAGLNAMHSVAKHVLGIATRPPSSMSVAAAKQLRFLGMDNIKNKSAVDNLIRMGSAGGATSVWAHHGSSSGLEGKLLLDGVKVSVLGPPTLEQTEKISKMRSSDPDQFWQLLGGRSARRLDLASIEPGPDGAGGLPVPPQARWFRNRVARLNADQMLQIVRTLDQQMNNTSLILLFEIGARKLLFPGDAQIENWSWALVDAPDAAQTRKRLASVDFYKVGHHGSRNATPKKLLWENFMNRGGPKGRRLKTALSTLPGKHGSSSSKTEVPRSTLLHALEEETDLVTTQGFKCADNADPCQLITIQI
ncbi:MAG: MBL fold metallo-hydrolase [Burkholderiales bacterium]